MQIIDTHAHLCDLAFEKDLGEVLDRANGAGVRAVVAVGEDFADARRNLALSEDYSMLRPAAGLYPTRLDMREAMEIASWIRKKRERLTAIAY